jgi:hypothetical protein
MALRKTILTSLCLQPNCDVTEALQSGNFLGFCRTRQGYEEEGEVYDCYLSEGDRRVAVICLTLIMSNRKLTSPSDISSAGCCVASGVTPPS